MSPGDGAIEAVGGTLGGAGTPSGERVVVRWSHDVLEVFHETGSQRFHRELISELAVEPNALTGETLKVVAARTGLAVPTSFAPGERAELDRIVTALRTG